MLQDNLDAFLQGIRGGEVAWFPDSPGVTGLAAGLGDLRGLFHRFPTDSMHKMCECTYKHIMRKEIGLDPCFEATLTPTTLQLKGQV